MTGERIKRWISEKGDVINQTIRIMCGMSIKETEGKFTFDIKGELGGGSHCLFDVDKRYIEIHVGIPEWMCDDIEACSEEGRILMDEYSKRHVEALGHEPNEDDLFAFYLGAAMHEFMHAAITRTGTMFTDILARFPMKNKNPTRFQKDFYEANAKKLFHLLFNCVCDARIENVGKQTYNVASYFDLHRLVDYASAIKASSSNFWNFGYSLLQLGVIGQLPLFELSADVLDTINAITDAPIVGSTNTRNYLDEFICEKDPKTSVEMFIKWFDIPKVHAFVEKYLEEEIEGKSEAAQALAKLLEEIGEEVVIKSRSAKGMSSPIALEIPIQIKPQKCLPNGGGKNSASDSQEEDEDSQGMGSADSADPNEEDSDSQEDEKSSNNSSQQGGNKSDDQNSADSENAQKNQSGNPDNKATHTEEHGSDDPSYEDSRTFDKDGDWSTHGNGSVKLDKAPELKNDPQLRNAIDKALQAIKPKAKVVNKPKEKKSREKKKKPVTAKDLSTAGLVVDNSFKPHLMAPQKVIKMAKPLRAVLKRAIMTEQEDDVTGLKSGTLNAASLYKLGNSDLSVFKIHRLPTINTAVYYFLWDGSGSMCGSKQLESGIACATIEEAVRGLYPFKIVNFYTAANGAVHHVVKDFDESSKKNYAYSFSSMRCFTGGNKDGYAIRCAVEELIKRKETNKFLYVLSDGAPSAYRSTDEATTDVKNAVAFARQNHIDVTSIFFGSKHERDQEIDLYREMYGKGHIISCDPDQLVTHLVQIVKKNIHR